MVKRRGGAGVRRLLMEKWDPIGVAGVPEAADEYDTYVGQVGRRLREGATAEEIAAYLTYFARSGWVSVPRRAPAKRKEQSPTNSPPGTGMR